MSITADLAEYHDHLAMGQQIQAAQLVWNAINAIKDGQNENEVLSDLFRKQDKAMKEISAKNLELALTVERMEKEADIGFVSFTG